MNLQELAELLKGSLQGGDPAVEIDGVNTLAEAGQNQATFLANMKYRSEVSSSRAGVILVGHDFSDDSGRALIRVDNPYLSFAHLQRHFHPQPQPSGNRHPSAVIDASARIADDVDVGAQAVIGKGVSIGRGSIVSAGCVVEDNAVIGEQCLLHSRAVVCHGCVLGDRVILQAGAVIGSDGFGYAWTGREHLKIPQSGRVVLQDDVEIGANSCIDRGALGDTVIGHGVKLDNLIQIGHNVEVGALSIMASQVGISGSTKIGMGCQIGGQVGMAGHLKVGDRTQIAAKAGVIGDLEGGASYAGFPAVPHRVWLKMSVAMNRLPELLKLLKVKKD